MLALQNGVNGAIGILHDPSDIRQKMLSKTLRPDLAHFGLYFC